MYPHERMGHDVWGFPTEPVSGQYRKPLRQTPAPATRRPYLEFDTECARNYWLLKLYFPMGMTRSFELHPHKPAFYDWELAAIQQAMDNFTWVGFNSIHYDHGMLKLALRGVGVAYLKEANDAIIPGKGWEGLKHWEFAKRFPLADYQLQNFDHIDIAEVVPGVKIGLKTYMARMHSKTIQDLPFDPEELLSPEKQVITDTYCGNDLAGTRQLREEVQSRLRMREKLTETYSADMRSKSDAQMSEAIIASRLGYSPEKRYLPTGYQFKLQLAPWLDFCTPQMRQVLAICKAVTFFWSNKEDGEPIVFPDGSKIKTGVNMPPELAKLRIAMGRSVYKFGIGGLHSTEKCQTVYSIPGVQQLQDSDVGSFYPAVAILMKLFSPEIMAIYEDIFNLRMANKAKTKELKAKVKECEAALDAAMPEHAEVLKRALKEAVDALDDVDTATSGYKIVLNGWYGKLWSKYSFALNPDAGIAITINGQLSLLMLIERLEVGGVRVISANTDGIVTCCPTHLIWYRDSTMVWWEKATGLGLEHNPYRSIHSRDVNAYTAVTMDGEAKRKGVFSKSGILASMQGVHPDRDIAKDAAVAFVLDGTPVSDTVRACKDIRKFIVAKSVKGGGQWRGQFLGKTVRWYYSTNGESIHYISNNNKVASSDGACPVQVLPEEFPADVDYAAYEKYAIELLIGAGVVR